MKDKILNLSEKNKFIYEDDVGDNIKFRLKKNGDLEIRCTSLQTVDRHLDLDKSQVKRLVKFLKAHKGVNKQ